MKIEKTKILNFEIVIAGITIRFQTDHQSDIDCLERLFLYHKNTETYEGEKIIHNVIINSSSKKFNLPVDIEPVLEGFASNEYNIQTIYYNSKIAKENYVTIGKDICIHHIPEEKLTTCFLQEKKNTFRKSHRPLLNIYIFLLIHNILSMYGKYSVHSACVAKNGFAYLFLGKSGYGKTTISTLLGKAGFDYMGDDLTFISRDENGEIVVDAFLHSAKIVNEKETNNDVIKNIVDVIREYNFAYSYRQKLGAIFLLKRDYINKKSTLQLSSQADAYASLIHSGNHIKMQYNPKLWLDICEQVTSQPCYSFNFANKEYFNLEIFNNIIK